MSNAIRSEMLAAAKDAAEKYFKERMGGKDAYACGFAWVTIYPKYKGNTSAGRDERRTYAALGFRKDYTGKAYELWNPSGLPVQNIDVKEVGALAAAAVLRTYGFDAESNSRLD